MFSKSSRSASLASLASNHSMSDSELIQTVEIQGEDVPNTQRYEDQNFRFTNSHPLGKIFLKLMEDMTYLARKTNNKDMVTNVDDLCSSFHNAIKLERSNINTKVKDTASKVEENLIRKELSSHSINASVVPPAYYNPTPVITSPQKLTEIIKIFPKQARFSGNSQKDGQMSVVEFLNNLTSAQNQCCLSEPEFIDRILAATTGLAHELVLDWKINGETAASIYHNLVVNFDNRMSAEEARQKLNNFIISKNSSLAKAESNIQLLVARASTLLPPGDSRKAYKDMEGCTVLIRALPPYSSVTAGNMYQSLTTRLGRACTMQELFMGLNQYRGMIDRDIKTNGATPTLNSYNKRANIRNNTNRFSSFYGASENNNGVQKDRFVRPTPPPPPNMFKSRQNEVSYTPRPKIRKFGAGNNQNKTNMSQNRYHNNMSSNFQKPYANKPNIRSNSCSLCGRGHNTTECNNIRDDKNRKLDILPTYGVCEKCPVFVKPRLHHPEAVCPFRVGGPLNRGTNRGNNHKNHKKE